MVTVQIHIYIENVGKIKMAQVPLTEPSSTKFRNDCQQHNSTSWCSNIPANCFGQKKHRYLDSSVTQTHENHCDTWQHVQFHSHDEKLSSTGPFTIENLYSCHVFSVFFKVKTLSNVEYEYKNVNRYYELQKLPFQCATRTSTWADMPRSQPRIDLLFGDDFVTWQKWTHADFLCTLVLQKTT